MDPANHLPTPAERRRSSLYGWRALVAATNIRLSRRVADCLAALAIPHEVVSADAAGRSERAGTVVFLESAALRLIQRVPRPCVIICSGERIAIADWVLSEVADGDVAVVALRDLTPVSVLRGIMVAAERRDLLELRDNLRSQPRLAAVPASLIDAFLVNPARFTGLRDICRAFGLSKVGARELVREARFERAEHLLTVLRAEAWLWFERRGIKRTAFEPYLGLTSRSNFRRACRRAGIDPPWEDIERPL